MLVHRPRPPEKLYGRIILDHATALGIHPLEAALMMTSILGNLAGSKAAVVDLEGRRVVPGFNILRPGTRAARFQALLDRLIEPVRTAQDAVRKIAAGCSRTLVDLWEGGQAKPDKHAGWDLIGDEMASRSRRHEVRARNTDLLQHGFELPDRTRKPYDAYEGLVPNPRDPGPGVFHLPGFLIWGLDVEGIAQALGEVHDRRAFVFDPAGKLWETSPPKKCGTDLAGLLRGQDLQFAPVLPNQGYGSWVHAKIGLFSTLPMDSLVRLLDEPGDPRTEALEHCLLMKSRRASSSRAEVTPPPGACAGYSRVVSRILSQRLSDADAGHYSLFKDAQPLVAGFQEQIFQICEKAGPAFSRFTAHFHDLGFRVLWALLELRQGEPLDQIIDGAFFIAKAAIRDHVALLAAANLHGDDPVAVAPSPGSPRPSLKRKRSSRRRERPGLPVAIRKR